MSAVIFILEEQGMSEETPCTREDSIKCLKCGRVSKVSELIAKNGHRIPKTEEHGFWQSVFFYCQCDLEHPKVWDAGDGDLFIVYLSKTELIR